MNAALCSPTCRPMSCGGWLQCPARPSLPTVAGHRQSLPPPRVAGMESGTAAGPALCGRGSRRSLNFVHPSFGHETALTTKGRTLIVSATTPLSQTQTQSWPTCSAKVRTGRGLCHRRRAAAKQPSCPSPSSRGGGPVASEQTPMLPCPMEAVPGQLEAHEAAIGRRAKIANTLAPWAPGRGPGSSQRGCRWPRRDPT